LKAFLQRVSVMLLSSFIVAGCAADRIHREGLQAVDRGDYEEGIAKLEEAYRSDPGNLTYRMDARAHRDGAVQQLIATGDSARASGRPDVAEAMYRRVLGIDPGNDRAFKGLAAIAADRRHAERAAKATELFAAKQYDAAEAAVRAVLSEDPSFAPATALAARIDLVRGPTTVMPHLHTSDNRPVSLQFRDAQTKMVFEVLARQTGINFIFDKDVKSDSKTTIFVNQVPVEAAIDLILAQNQLARQVLSENMVLVYPNTQAKQKDYQDEVVRTFYLANAAPKDAESMLKTVLGTKTLFIDERSSTIVMRDKPEHVRMAEKLIASLDVAEPEVMLEFEVLEVTRTTLDQIGINYPTNVSFSATSPSGGSNLTVSDVKNQNGDTITVSPLSVSVDLLKTVGLSNVLASPRIRAKNKEKAKVLIGNRVPVITSGVSATTGGSYSTSNVQYLDVGLTLEVQPTVHLDGNVAIKVGLEVSSITDTVDVPIGNGATTRAYNIGTRNANTLLQLKDGETQVLAGLIQDVDRQTSSRVPGLGDIPVLGRLFGSWGTNRQKNEIVLAITPRIIRAQSRPTSEMTEFWYGTESGTRTVPFSSGGAGTATAAGAAASGPVTPGTVSFGSGGAATPTAAPTAAVARAAPSRLDTAVAAPAVPAAARDTKPESAAATDTKADGAGAGPAAAAAAAAPAPAPAPGKPAITIEGPDTAKVGEEISVAVRLSAAEALGRVRAQVRFDAGALQLVSAEPGDLASSAETPKVDLKPGGIQLDVAGTADAPVEGGGTVLNMRFKVVAPRPVAIATQVVLVGPDGVAIAATPATPLKITVSP
jgi:general secretion pathway protein D